MSDEDPDPNFKLAIIVLAIVEAMVLIPVMIYMLVNS
jgi:hypothetical protein